jgi:hypothetical protein
VASKVGARYARRKSNRDWKFRNRVDTFSGTSSKSGKSYRQS